MENFKEWYSVIKNNERLKTIIIIISILSVIGVFIAVIVKYTPKFKKHMSYQEIEEDDEFEDDYEGIEES